METTAVAEVNNVYTSVRQWLEDETKIEDRLAAMCIHTDCRWMKNYTATPVASPLWTDGTITFITPSGWTICLTDFSWCVWFIHTSLGRASYE